MRRIHSRIFTAFPFPDELRQICSRSGGAAVGAGRELGECKDHLGTPCSATLTACATLPAACLPGACRRRLRARPAAGEGGVSFVARVITALALAGGAFALWELRSTLLLAFGGLLFAVIFSRTAKRLQGPGLSQRGGVLLTVLAMLLAAAALFWWIGGELAAQSRDLREQLPQAIETARSWLSGTALGSHAVEAIDEIRQREVPWARLAGLATLTFAAIGNFLLMVVLGIFLALEPALYRRGFLRLLPVARRDQVADALDAAGDALGSWLKGQGVSMLFVGVTTWIGLALLGVPLALILGVLAGLLDFVPFFGPIVSGLIAVLLAFMQGPETALYVALLALAIQQLEGYLLMPLVQRWAVHLPPALALISVVVAAGLFGIPGVLFATPLMVVLMVLVRKLYVEDTLENGASRPPDPR